VSVAPKGCLLFCTNALNSGPHTVHQYSIRTNQPPTEDPPPLLAMRVEKSPSPACCPDQLSKCDLNPHAHPPMQSVFKFPSRSHASPHRTRTLSLDQPIRFCRVTGFSPQPIAPQDKYPKRMSISRCVNSLGWTYLLSDNTALTLFCVSSWSGSRRRVRQLHRRPGFICGQRAWPPSRHSGSISQLFEPASAVNSFRRINDDSPLTPEHTGSCLGG